MNYWKNRKILITGGARMVGSHVSETLVKQGARITIISTNISSRKAKRNLRNMRDKINLIQTDLRDLKQCYKACQGQETIMNLVARVVGIEYNRLHPEIMFRDEVLISSNMLDAAVKNRIEKFLVVSSACVYSKCTVPTPENEGFKDAPEPTNEGYGGRKG